MGFLAGLIAPTWETLRRLDKGKCWGQANKPNVMDDY